MESGDASQGGYGRGHGRKDIAPLREQAFKKNDLKPHKSTYWLNPKIKDWQAFVIQVTLICQLILEAIRNDNASRHLISVDEKTGIQALERITADQPMQEGQARRLEYEYERHGTSCLMAAVDVGQGEIVYYRLHPTRTEEDFLIFIQGIVERFPANEAVVLLADQLNTHMSASLVEWIAGQIGFEDDLGKKNYNGILKNKESRKIFLENPEHRIRFVYTPKHCSWLNPIENWFGKLQRHVIRYGNFSSVKELENKIESYIDYYNLCLIKPLKWKFKGFIKTEKNSKITV